MSGDAVRPGSADPGDSIPRRRGWSKGVAGGLTVAALAWTVLASVVLAVAPLVASESASVGPADSGTGEVVTTSVRHESLLEHEGSSVLIGLAVPVAVAALGAWPWRPRRARGARIAAGVVMTAFALVGAASVGLFYLPAAVLLLLAGAQTRRTRPRRPWSDPVTGGLAVTALAWTVLASVVLAVVPDGTRESPSVVPARSGTGPAVATNIRQESLLEQEGSSLLVLLTGPVAVAVLGAWPWKPRWARGARIVAGVVMTGIALVGLWSAGLAYPPGAVLLLLAGAKTRGPREPDTVRALGRSSSL